MGNRINLLFFTFLEIRKKMDKNRSFFSPILPTLIFLQFTFFENVSDMLANNASVTLEQPHHLINRQPDGISIKCRLNLSQAILCCVDNNTMLEEFPLP